MEYCDVSNIATFPCLCKLLLSFLFLSSHPIFLLHSFSFPLSPVLISYLYATLLLEFLHISWSSSFLCNTNFIISIILISWFFSCSDYHLFNIHGLFLVISFTRFPHLLSILSSPSISAFHPNSFVPLVWSRDSSIIKPLDV